LDAQGQKSDFLFLSTKNVKSVQTPPRSTEHI
jgi:hypothetical protein